MNFIDNNVTFKDILTARITTGGLKIAKGEYRRDGNNNIINSMPVINAIDIDWCKAQVPGIDDPITSTGQLLAIIGQLKQVLGGEGNTNSPLLERISDIEQSITNIQLTPGPQGPRGSQGPQGSQGPIGSFDASILEDYATKNYVDNSHPKLIVITSEEYTELETYETDAIYFVIGDAIDNEGEEDETFDASKITTNLYINDVQHLEDNVTLEYGNTYEISGTLRGKITIEIPENTEPENYTNIILNNVTIVSDDEYAIGYITSEGAKKQKGLSVTIEKNSFNRLVCLTEHEIADGQSGALYSMNNLDIQGSGYLAIQNNGGHGIRGKELMLTNLHLWCDAIHDGVHGKNVKIIGGTYYFNKCNDAFATANNEETDSGHILFFDGKIKYHTLNGQLLDSKKLGIYFNENLLTAQELLLCNNMNLISKSSYNQYVGKAANAVGNIISYNSKSDYQSMENGELLDLETITKTITYGEGAAALTAEVYEITSPWISINGYLDKPIYFTPSTFGSVNASVKLNGAYLTHNNQLHTILYGAESGNVHIFSVQDKLNIIENTYIDNNKIQLECDAVKSENNIEVESKADSILYVSSLSTDGFDGGEVRLTESKGHIVIANCGQRGIKGNAIVIGPKAVITSSVINSYYTNPSNTNNYTTYEGIVYVKNNCKVCQPCNLTGSTNAEHNESGFADIFARNGKSANKGAFGTTNNELKGHLIVGSIGAILRMDFGNANHLYYNETYTSDNHSTVILNDPGVTDESKYAYDLSHQIHG